MHTCTFINVYTSNLPKVVVTVCQLFMAACVLMDSPFGSEKNRFQLARSQSGYGGYTEEQGMVGTQRNRVWWVHRGAGYGEYTEE